VTATIEARREVEFAKYRKAYKDPAYHMGAPRAMSWRFWIYKQHCLHGYSSVLDVACGRGEALDIAREWYTDVEGYEVTPALCERRDVTRIPGIHALPAADDSFDVVACQDMFEHILEEDVQPGMRELFRVARHKVFLSVAWFECQCGKKMGMDLHVTMHPLEWWLDQIEQCKPEGATVEEVKDLPRYEQTAMLEITL
jgi:SAM-dependent methyltransferase